MIKIVVTIADATEMVNTGADLEKRSAIIDIPETSIPRILKEYLKDRKYQSVSFSLLDEEI